MESPSDPSEADLEPNEFKFPKPEPDSDFYDSEEEEEVPLDESENDFSLELMNSLYEDQQPENAEEIYSKYSELLFGNSEGSSTCPLCEFASENLLELRIHMSKAHDGQKVYCIQCDYSVARRESLLIHVRKVHEGRGFPCQTCDYIAGTKQHLDRHNKHVHEGYRRLKVANSETVWWNCDFCDYKTKRRYELKNHFATAHEGKRFTCELCDFTAKRKDKINLHIKVVHEGLGKKCDFCDYKAGTNQHLQRHVRSKHANVEDSGIELGSSGEYSRQERLTEHVQKEHNGESLLEDVESSDRKNMVREHARVVHGGKKFQCDQCEFHCQTHGGLYLHQKAVHLGIRFKCNQCSYEGTQEVNLKRHIESKHGTVQYCCKLCSAKTKGLWYIETHLKKVHGVTDKTEYSKYLLIKDIEPVLVNNKSNMSDCSIVENDDDPEDVDGAEDDSLVDPTEFLDQSRKSGEFDAEDFDPNTEDDSMSNGIPDLELLTPNVELKMEDNQTEEDYDDAKRKLPKHTCKQCGFVANSSGTLTRHVSIVHKGVKWSCKLCGYISNVKCSMIRHIQSIHMGWRYQCGFCDHEATQKGGLKYHIEKRHPGAHPVPKWSALEPVKSKRTSQIPGIENMDVNSMFEEVCDPPEDTLTNGVDIGEEDYEEDEIESLMFEPAVQILEEDSGEFETTNDEDLAEEMEDGEAAQQYVGEDHDFSELYAQFNNNGETEVQCDLCTYKTSRIGNMRRHVSASHQGIRFPCHLCNYKAPDKGSLMRHTRGVHQGIKFYCDFCSYSASQKGNLKKHVEMKHPDKEYVCPYCNFKVNWKGSFIKHMQNLHGDLMSIHGLTTNGLSSSLMSFNSSLNTNSNNESLDRTRDSIDQSDEEMPKKFTILPKIVEKPREVVEKKRGKNDECIILHPDSDSLGNINPDACFDPENMTFVCPLCDFKAQSAASLARHNTAIHKGVRWKCKDCEFITRDKSSLKRHRRNRHDGIRYQCNYCDYDAGQKGNIKSHMDRRHPDIPYDHTEFQQVKVEKSKYTRELKQQHEYDPQMETFRAFQKLGRSLSPHLLSSFVQSKGPTETKEEDEEDFIRIDNIADINDSYDDIAEYTDEDDNDEEVLNGSVTSSSPRSNEDINSKFITTSTPTKADNHSILLSALQSIPKASTTPPSLTPRKSILDDLAVSSNMLEMLRNNKTPPKSPSTGLIVKSKRYNHGSPTIPTENDPDATLACSECDYMAKSQGTLFRHIQAIHRGVRFHCKLCDFVTIDKGSLKRHVNGQHDGIKHKCDFCDYENAQIGNVKKHIETKHQNIVYYCPYCDLKAKHKWYLEQHVKKVHCERIEEFDIKTVSPSVDHSIVSHGNRKQNSADVMCFLDMFGNHPMAQFFVPDANKTVGGDEGEDDIIEDESSETKF